MSKVTLLLEMSDKVKYEIQHRTRDRNLGSTYMSQTGRIVYLQKSHRKFVIVMCMMIEIQDLEGVHKRCPPKEDQHKKLFYFSKHVLFLLSNLTSIFCFQKNPKKMKLQIFAFILLVSLFASTEAQFGNLGGICNLAEFIK